MPVAQKKQLAPWWLYFILVPLLAFVMLFVAVIIRFTVGLSTISTPRESGIELLAWLGYLISWLIFAYASRRDSRFFAYVPRSVLVLCGAIVLLYLIT